MAKQIGPRPNYDYAVEAARARLHVLCEAPMAVTADECRRMIRTCQTNRVKLMMVYRLHFRPAVLRALNLVRLGRSGSPRPSARTSPAG